MKKKIITFVLVVTLIFSLTSCGSALTKDNTEVTKEIVEAVDKYLDGTISVDDAYGVLSEYFDKLEITDDEDASEIMSAMNAAFDIFTEMSVLRRGEEGDNEIIIDRRNELANIIGEKSREE